MSFDYQNKNASKQKIIDSSTSKNTEEFEIIKKYLNGQPDIISNLNNISRELSSTINNFIEYTKNYSSQIEFLAMKMVPNYSIEGQLIQAIQTFLLFYSEGLNNLISEIRMNMIMKQEEDINQVIEQFKIQKKLYYEKIKNINHCHRVFKKEINLYQEFLISNEYKEHQKKGEKTENDIIFPNTTFKRSETYETENNFVNIEENIFSYQLSEVDNKSKLIKSNKDYIKHINESNELLNKIRQFLALEKTNILKSIYNICHRFGEVLLNSAKNITNNFETQKKVINKLLNRLILDEKDTTILTDTTIKLKYLEIYKNNISEKLDLQNNITNNINNETNGNKEQKKENKNDIHKKNIALTTDDAKTGINKEFQSRKTVGLSSKNLNYDYLSRTSFNPNQINYFSEIEKEELFESIVKKLSTEEIINIFEKIKKTNITLNESDIKLIEYLRNYKKLKEILFVIFNQPEKYSENDKTLLLDFFEKDKKYIFYFIKILNDHRTKSCFSISELTLNYLGEIFKNLNNFILKENNMEQFKYILILSQTYYFFSEKDKTKIYLFSYIKDCPNYSNPKFWEDYLKELINYDLKKSGKNDINIDKMNLDHFKKEEKENLVNCFFSNLLTITKVMADFNSDKTFVREFVEKNKTKYYLSQQQVDNICLLYEMSINENEVALKNNNIKNEKEIDENNNVNDTNKKEIDNETINNNEDKNNIGHKILNENKINNKNDEIGLISEIKPEEKNNENNFVININEKKEIKYEKNHIEENNCENNTNQIDEGNDKAIGDNLYKDRIKIDNLINQIEKDNNKENNQNEMVKDDIKIFQENIDFQKSVNNKIDIQKENNANNDNLELKEKKKDC